MSTETKASYVIASVAFLMLVGTIVFSIRRDEPVITGSSIPIWLCLSVAISAPAMVKDKKDGDKE